MTPSTDRPTVYYDGACPLCRAEIGLYKRARGSDGLRWVDVSEDAAATGAGLTRDQALARFHVRGPSGGLVSGAAGFAALWRALPGWAWLGRLAERPSVLRALERAYLRFLPLRPRLAALLGERRR